MPGKNESLADRRSRTEQTGHCGPQDVLGAVQRRSRTDMIAAADAQSRTSGRRWVTKPTAGGEREAASYGHHAGLWLRSERMLAAPGETRSLSGPWGH